PATPSPHPTGTGNTVSMTDEAARPDEEYDVSVPKLMLADHAETAIGKSRADAVIVGTVATTDGLALATGAEAADERLDGQLLDTLQALGATGKAEEIVRVPTFGSLTADVVIAAGIGSCEPAEAPASGQVRGASGEALRARYGCTGALNSISGLDVAVAAEGSALGAYEVDAHSCQAPEKRPVSTVECVKPEDGTAREHRATLKTAS